MTDKQPNYRWVIVCSCALILAIAMGAIVNGLSAFIVPMHEQFGWSCGTYGVAAIAGVLNLVVVSTLL